MMITEQIYTQALLLAGDIPDAQKRMLQILCQGAASALGARLREGLTAEDCKADFIAAASLFALASLNSVDETRNLELFQAGDMPLRRGKWDAASNCLRNQAGLMIAPYLKDSFSFRGV